MVLCQRKFAIENALQFKLYYQIKRTYDILIKMKRGGTYMKEERLKILEMLEQGKINADEAGQLLEQFKSQSNEGSFFDWIKSGIAAINGYRHQVEFESNPAGNGIKAINMYGKNANVSAKVYGGSTLKIKCEYVSKTEDAQITFLEDDGVCELSYNDNEIKSLAIKCYVPETFVETVNLTTSNGRVTTEGINCDKLRVGTTNGRIKIEKTTAKTAEVETTNGAIKLERVAIADADLHTTNGGISVEDFDAWQQEYHLKARTTNGGIVVELPAETGIKLDAKTTNGGIHCNSIQEQNTKGYVGKVIRGQNQLYDSAAQKITLELSTTNGGIKVVD